MHPRLALFKGSSFPRNSPPYSLPAGSTICSQFQVTRMGPGSLQNSAVTSASRPITPDTSLTLGVKSPQNKRSYHIICRNYLSGISVFAKMMAFSDRLNDGVPDRGGYLRRPSDVQRDGLALRLPPLVADVIARHAPVQHKPVMHCTPVQLSTHLYSPWSAYHASSISRVAVLLRLLTSPPPGSSCSHS